MIGTRLPRTDCYIPGTDVSACHHLSGATWHFHCSPTVDHRWTTAVPPVNGGRR
ncbi:hypothetical protein Tco_0062433, partial [Tanacetum coccineum]